MLMKIKTKTISIHPRLNRSFKILKIILVLLVSYKLILEIFPENQAIFSTPGKSRYGVLYKNNEQLLSIFPTPVPPVPPGQDCFKQFPTPGPEGPDLSRGLPGLGDGNRWNWTIHNKGTLASIGEKLFLYWLIWVISTGSCLFCLLLSR